MVEEGGGLTTLIRVGWLGWGQGLGWGVVMMVVTIEDDDGGAGGGCCGKARRIFSI